MDIEEVALELELGIENTLTALKQDLSKINIGRAQSDIFDLIKIDYYGAQTALQHISVISVIDYNKITIEPYEKPYLKVIEKAIRESGLDINPQINGSLINIYFPQMTLERRDKLIKLAKEYGEKAKVAIRNHRRNAIKSVESLKLGKDLMDLEIKRAELLITKTVSSIEELVGTKNKNLRDLK
jgi:ribosome recycling factor